MPRPANVSPEEWERFLDEARRMTPSEKLQRAFECSARARGLEEAGMRRAYPQAAEPEIFLRCAPQRLGHELFHKVYGNELPAEDC